MRKLKLRNTLVSSILTIALSILSSSLVYAQDVGSPVHGNVTDSSRKPISGASVVNLKTGKGTSTDQDGNFTINAAKGQTLQISFIGYLTEKVVYKGQAQMAVSLVTGNPNLADVVVIGYGTQRKEAVTGSVASITGNNLREVPSANISEALQGRLPGVAVSGRLLLSRAPRCRSVSAVHVR